MKGGMKVAADKTLKGGGIAYHHGGYVWPRLLYSYTVPCDNDVLGRKWDVWKPCIKNLVYMGYLENPSFTHGGINDIGFAQNVRRYHAERKYRKTLLPIQSLSTVAAFIVTWPPYLWLRTRQSVAKWALKQLEMP